MSPRIRILLLVSLAVNLFLAGAAITVVGGRMFHPDRGMMRGFAAGGFPPPPALLQALPPESRARLRKEIGDREEGRALFRQARDARVTAYRALTAEPFSQSALDAALAASREADLKAVQRIHDVTSRITKALTPEERVALTAELKRCFEAPPAGPPPEGCERISRRGGHMFPRKDGDRDSPRPDRDDDAPPPDDGPGPPAP